MSRPLVVLTDDTIHPAAAALLARTCEVAVLAGAYPTEAKLIAACAGARGILARLGTVTRQVIERAPRLAASEPRAKPRNSRRANFAIPMLLADRGILRPTRIDLRRRCGYPS